MERHMQSAFWNDTVVYVPVTTLIQLCLKMKGRAVSFQNHDFTKCYLINTGTPSIPSRVVTKLDTGRLTVLLVGTPSRDIDVANAIHAVGGGERQMEEIILVEL